MRSRSLFGLALFLLGCGPSTPAQFPEPKEDPDAPAAPPAPARVANHTWRDAELICDQSSAGSRGELLRLRREVEDEAAASRGALLGISAPQQPSRRRVKNHVRRKPAQAVAGSPLDPDVAKAINDASYDTTRCAQHEAKSADIVVEVTVDKGAVAKVRTSSANDDALTRCLLEVACDVPAPTKAAAMRAGIPLRVRSMRDDVPKITVVSQNGSVPSSTFTRPSDANESAENDPAILGGLAREAATACEQGQLLLPQGRSVVVGLSASPHSTVQPTVNVGIGAMSEPAPPDSLVNCMKDRMEGFRLPLSPWHGVGQMGFRVMWDG